MKVLPVLLLSFFVASPPPSDLEEQVSAYWALLIQGDKAAALEMVVPEATNAFIERQEPPMRSWKLVRVKHRSKNEAVVTVEVERMIPGGRGFHRTPVTEKWVFDGQSWKVWVRPVSGADFLRSFTSGVRPPESAALSGKVRVSPATLRIHFLSSSQLGAVGVENGLGLPIRILRVDYDPARFQLLDGPREIAPGQVGKIALRYKGDEIAKDLTSRLTLVVQQGAVEKTYTIPVLYNYLSQGARKLFGLSDEAAEKLKRGQRVVPVIMTPAIKKLQQEREKELEKDKSSKPPSTPTQPPPAGRKPGLCTRFRREASEAPRWQGVTPEAPGGVVVHYVEEAEGGQRSQRG